MSRFRWPVLVILICLPVAVLATGVPLPFLDAPVGGPIPRTVRDGDREIAWLHTTTNGTTWERFVVGVARAKGLVPGLTIDDSRAFLDQTTAVPEIVLSMSGQPGKVHIRWYKLSSDAPTGRWVKALAQRSPAPLAIIGGGSSDRAKELAEAMAGQSTWQGEQPLLLLTTATADQVVQDVGEPSIDLTAIYPERSFRFCFTNRQMAESVLDFVWSTPGLKPESFTAIAPGAIAGGLALSGLSTPFGKPSVYSIVWDDDPYSSDLHRQFSDLVLNRSRFQHWAAPFSIGGFTGPNSYEAKIAESILGELRKRPSERSLLILPTVTPPARRVLRRLTETDPDLRQTLVAVTGDGIPVNAMFRDGDFAWPVHAIPVPVVGFAHNDPLGWDDPIDAHPGYALVPPNSTEDVLHFTDLTRVLAGACFGPGGLITGAEDLATRLRTRSPAFFDATGNRLGGTGEYVTVLWPLPPTSDPEAYLEAWRRGADRRWVKVGTIPIDQRRTRVATPAVIRPDRVAGGPPKGPRG